MHPSSHGGNYFLCSSINTDKTKKILKMHKSVGNLWCIIYHDIITEFTVHLLQNRTPLQYSMFRLDKHDIDKKDVTEYQSTDTKSSSKI